MDLDQLVAKERNDAAEARIAEITRSALWAAEQEAARIDRERTTRIHAEIEARRVAEAEAKTTAEAARLAAIKRDPVTAALRAIATALKCMPHYNPHVTGVRPNDYGLHRAVEGVDEVLQVLADLDAAR
jgi:hypothetical protein